MEEMTLTGGTPNVATNGTAGLQTQVGNNPTTVSAAAKATGGVDAGNFIEPEINPLLRMSYKKPKGFNGLR